MKTSRLNNPCFLRRWSKFYVTFTHIFPFVYLLTEVWIVNYINKDRYQFLSCWCLVFFVRTRTPSNSVSHHQNCPHPTKTCFVSLFCFLLFLIVDSNFLFYWYTRVPIWPSTDFLLIIMTNDEIQSIRFVKDVILTLVEWIFHVRRSVPILIWVLLLICLDCGLPMFWFLCIWWEVTPWNVHITY